MSFKTMCGIAGIINGGSPEVLQAMEEILEHRGPDDSGIKWFSETSSGLAHRRLSIVDLSPLAHQPMKNSTGKRWITYNGELYNFQEIKKQLVNLGYIFHSQSDTEVILAAYDEWGPECLKRFNGMFAFGIYDTEKRELFLARDHLGIKPLYYTQKENTFAFASESKALFCLPSIKKEIEPDAVLSSLLLLWVPEPKTGYKEIFKLPAGHYAYFKNGRLDLHEYWDVPIRNVRDPIKTESQYIEELRHLLEKAVSGQLMSDVPVGAFLSGGLDSSLIVALMRKFSPGKKISTYTIGFSQQDRNLEAMPDDALYAEKVAKLFDTDHHEINIQVNMNELLPKLLWHLDDPIADGASINTYLICKAAKEKGTTVLLNGMGGDEVFGGYRKQLASLYLETYRKIPSSLRKLSIEKLIQSLPVEFNGKGIRLVRWARRFIKSANLDPLSAFIYGFAYFTPTDFYQLIKPELLPKNFEDLYAVQAYMKLAKKVEGLPLVDQMTYLDTKVFLSGLNLLYSDKAAMAASVETRPPLIDKDIVEFAARLPPEMKIKRGVQKYLLKRAAEAYLPKEIIYRPKASFGTPLRSWMKSGLDRTLKNSLMDTNALHNQYMKSSLPLDLLNRHQAGKEDHAHALWGCLATTQWIDQTL